jgi:uncharacterized protein with von Willebrand factor type A (vWA) domain
MSVGALLAGSLLVSAGGTAFGMFQAGEAAKIKEKQLRMQQTALRIQETEADIQNMDDLEHILAKQEVMAGVRNIGAGSGSLAALTNETFSQFDRINDRNKLNYATKRLSLSEASLANSMEKRNGMVKAGLGFAESAANVGLKYKSLLDMDTLSRRSGDISQSGAL